MIFTLRRNIHSAEDACLHYRSQQSRRPVQCHTAIHSLKTKRPQFSGGIDVLTRNPETSDRSSTCRYIVTLLFRNGQITHSFSSPLLSLNKSHFTSPDRRQHHLKSLPPWLKCPNLNAGHVRGQCLALPATRTARVLDLSPRRA